MQIIAHRACPLDRPENSLSGINMAAELGADAVEVDVRVSLDGVVVLMHDWSLGRTTAIPGPVRLVPSFVLRRLRLDGTADRVPTLKEAIEALPDGLGLAIEIKDAAACRETLQLIRSRKLEERAVMWSYREEAVRFFAREAPEIEGSLLRDSTDPEGLQRYLQDAVEYGARGISAHWSAITPQLVGEAHDRGLKVYSMTRDLETVAKKAAAGLDGIVTDYPREVRATVERAIAS
jgi:glycerophosphoryl diester phosphodiesterase